MSVLLLELESLRLGNGNRNLSAVDELRMRVLIPFCHQTFWSGNTNAKNSLFTFSGNSWRHKQFKQTISHVSVLFFVAEYGFNILLTNGMQIIFSFRIAWSYASWKMLFCWFLHYNRTQCGCMETYSVIFLDLIRRRDSICSITGKNYQELALTWKLRNKNNYDRSSRKQEKFLEKNL